MKLVEGLPERMAVKVVKENEVEKVIVREF